MQIAIVTVFNEFLNYGAYLQAFALQELLASRKIKATFIEERSLQRTKYKLRRLVSRQASRFGFNLRMAVTFASAHRRLQTTSLSSKHHYDAAILGSDEIWNLRNRTFIHSPIYFGAGINAGKLISYAASANGMSREDFAAHPRECSLLKRIDHLSARDPTTVALLSAVTGRQALEVLDPTFLVDWRNYEILPERSGYILVYCYYLSAERRRLIERLAKDYGTDVILIGQYSPGRVLVEDPLKFIGYIKNAAAVVTNSYHGTLLSIQYNKPFCCFVGENYKISCFLESLGLESRNGTIASDLTPLMRAPIDYSEIARSLADRRTQSIHFLEGALGLA